MVDVHRFACVYIYVYVVPFFVYRVKKNKKIKGEGSDEWING